MTYTGTMVLPKNAVVMNDDEMRYVEGGLGPVTVFVGGILVGWIADGVIKYKTGKSAADWVVVGMKKAKKIYNKSKGKILNSIYVY